MLPLTVGLMFLSLSTQAPEPALPVVLGKDLAQVPGPQRPDPRLLAPDVPMGCSPLEAYGRRAARRAATLPCLAVPRWPAEIQDQAVATAGWKAYRVEVGPRERLHARLRALHEAWFVVKVVNRWGQLEEGMLRSTLATGNPETTYENPKDQPATIFLVVDTTETGADQEPYRLQINRP
ncbi:MAG: hypothetical protein BWY56_00591 [Acidobacteria bacterium ADurb.Bin340]|nr:MAG: hypothetical protein BWY56_00591 [Acidobacteria bacterium ADurb.Bin340]